MFDLVFQSLLNHDFMIARPVRTTDSQGGWLITYALFATIEGRIRPATSREREIAQREERVITHVFYTWASYELLRGDLVIYGLIDFDGSTIIDADLIVKIEGVREPSKAAHHLEIDCIEYQHESADYAFTYVLEGGGFRLTEELGFRLLEDGSFRILE